MNILSSKLLLETGKRGKCKDLSEFEKGSSGVFLVCSDQYLSKVVQGSTDKVMSEQMSHCSSNCQKKVNAGPDRKVSEYTVQFVGLRAK